MGIQQNCDSEAVALVLVREVAHSFVLVLAEFEALVFECALHKGRGSTLQITAF